MINKLQKSLKAAFLSMLVAAFAVAGSGAYALSNNTTVVNSGNDAEIDTEVESETEIEVENKNDAHIHQSIEASSNTGGNKANGNISFGGSAASINTGAATTEVKADVSANKNMTLIDLGSSWGTSNTTDVVNTGNRADVDTEVETETEVEVENKNDAWVSQWVKSKANTGKNDANRNIGGASIDTSAAQVGTEVNADVNENATVVGNDSDLNGNGSMGLLNDTIITNTGRDADIDSKVKSEHEIEVENKNDLHVRQGLFGWSNSGKNDANRNIGEAEVMTGSALLLSKMGVSGNSNTTGIGFSALNPDSDTTTDVVNTGNDLDTDNDTEIEMEVEVENDSELWGSQWFRVKSNSGYNDTNRNLGGASVGSGNTGSGADVGYGGNYNTTVLGTLGSLLNLLAL